MYGIMWTECGTGWSDIPCLTAEFFKRYGAQWAYTLVIWPLVVCCKMVFMRVAPFHLATIGSTTFGAYMVHPYMPMPITTGLSLNVGEWFGDTLKPFVLFIYLTAYILL